MFYADNITCVAPCHLASGKVFEIFISRDNTWANSRVHNLCSQRIHNTKRMVSSASFLWAVHCWLSCGLPEQVVISYQYHQCSSASPWVYKMLPVRLFRCERHSLFFKGSGEFLVYCRLRIRFHVRANMNVVQVRCHTWQVENRGDVFVAACFMLKYASLARDTAHFRASLVNPWELVHLQVFASHEWTC